MPRVNPSASEAELSGEGRSQTVSALLRLRDLVLSGEYAPGERLAEIPLASRLNVSRTPLRLALTKLEHEGLVELHPTRGFIVRAFSLTDIYDSMELRGVIEGMAARLAAERFTVASEISRKAMESIKEVTGLLDVIVHTLTYSEQSLEDFCEQNERFHLLLLDLAQSDVIAREMDRVVRLPFASPSGFVRTQMEAPEAHAMLFLAQHQHHSIVEAIEARQGTRAEALTREHSHIARRNLEAVLKTHHHLIPGGSLLRKLKTDTTAPAVAVAVKSRPVAKGGIRAF